MIQVHSVTQGAKFEQGAIVMMDAICGTSEVGFLFVAPLERGFNGSGKK